MDPGDRVLMSYQLVFWRQDSTAAAPEEIYSRLCNKGSADGLLSIDIDEIVRHVLERFPSALLRDGCVDYTAENGAFSLEISPFFFLVTTYGMDGEDMNWFIDLAVQYGCRLYDPQTKVRYEG